MAQPWIYDDDDDNDDGCTNWGKKFFINIKTKSRVFLASKASSRFFALPSPSSPLIAELVPNVSTHK